MKTKTLKSSKYHFDDCGDWIGNNEEGLVKTTKAASALKSVIYKTKVGQMRDGDYKACSL